MKSLHKGILLAVLHLAIVGSLGAKLLYDRATRPRVWVRSASYDPDLPIRGRYASMRLEVSAPIASREVRGEGKYQWVNSKSAHLTVENGVLMAVPDERGSVSFSFPATGQNQMQAFLNEPVAFYIPEHALDPTRRLPGEELWVEVTVPKKGPPRPIQLAVKKRESFTPLDLR
jgi:hypothetical protein